MRQLQHRCISRLVLVSSLLLVTAAAVAADGQTCAWNAAEDGLGTALGEILQRARGREMVDFVVSTRRELHQIPELMYQERKTSALIQRLLSDLGIAFRANVAGTGIVATIGTGKPPTIALRADIDALPLEEEADVAFRSRHPGAMHACGHDAHAAMLLTAGRMLKQREGELPGTVLLLFQPAEEGGAGAKKMLDEGALGDASAIFGLHVWPSFETGVVGSRAGPIMAGSETFSVTVEGRGGHGALPHLTKDPILASAAIIQSLQAIVSRETDPIQSSVVSVTQINAGFANNVIPNSASLAGTFRSFSKAGMLSLKQRIREVVTQQAAVFGCSVDIHFKDEERPMYPPTINDAAAFDLASSVVKSLGVASNEGGEKKEHGAKVSFVEMPPMMPGEDFSFYQEQIPGCFLFLGIKNDAIGANQSLHTPKFKLDEEALPIGVAAHVGFVEAFFRNETCKAYGR